MNIDKAKLLNNFINIKNFANLNFLVCHKKLFCKNGIVNNIGSYVMFAIIFFHIITLIIFYAKQFHSLKNKIKTIIIISHREANKEKIITSNINTNKMLTSNLRINIIRKKNKINYKMETIKYIET